MEDVELVKRMTRPYIGGILKTDCLSKSWLITSITHWGISDRERYIVIGCMPEDYWNWSIRFEYRISFTHCTVTLFDDDRMMIIKTGQKEFRLYPPTHSLSGLWDLFMMADAIGTTDES